MIGFIAGAAENDGTPLFHIAEGFYNGFNVIKDTVSSQFKRVGDYIDELEALDEDENLKDEIYTLGVILCMTYGHLICDRR